MISNFERKRVPEHWAQDTKTPRAHFNCLSSRHHKVTAGGRPVGLKSRIDRYLRQRLGQIIGRGIAVKTFEGDMFVPSTKTVTNGLLGFYSVHALAPRTPCLRLFGTL